MSNPQVPAVRVRLALDISNWLPGTPTDIISGSPVQFPTGAAIQLEGMFSYGALSDSPSTVLDLSLYQSVVVALQSTATPHEGTTYWSATVANASFNNTVTKAQWVVTQPNTIAQVIAQIPSSVWTVLGTGSTPYWLVIYGVTWNNILASAAPAAAGTGYTVGDILTVAGGTPNSGATAATVKVTSISGGGGTGPITGVQIVTFGGWSANPSSPNSVTGGTGSSATLTLTFTTAAQNVPFSSFQMNVQDTGMPVGNVLIAPSLVGTQSFLCADGLYRKMEILLDTSTGLYEVVVVNQSGTSSP